MGVTDECGDASETIGSCRWLWIPQFNLFLVA
jgi:hypothetical protein